MTAGGVEEAHSVLFQINVYLYDTKSQQSYHGALYCKEVFTCEALKLTENNFSVETGLMLILQQT